MKTLSLCIFALTVIVCCSISANAQRQTKLYIDDGLGNFTTLAAPSGPATLTFPAGGGTIITSTTQLLYGTPSPGNNLYTTPGNYLFDVQYSSSVTDGTAAGALITSSPLVGGSAADGATGLTINATANASGTATALSVSATGGSTNNAIVVPHGNSGIGTTAPITQLHVAGNVPSAKLGTVPAGGASFAVFVAGRYAYVDGLSGTFQIFDVSNPASPVSMSSIFGGGTFHVYVSGRYAYLDEGSSLGIVDVSNPSAPVVTGSTTIGGSGYGGLYVTGRYAYTANGFGNSMSIVDVSNPASPSVVSTFTTGVNDPRSVFVSGRYAYLTNNGTSTLEVIDISNPSSPSFVGSTPTGGGSGGPWGVYVSGRYAYVANYITFSSGSFEVFDISNPASPTSLDILPVGPGPISVFVSGRYAYITNSNSDNVEVIDISNPTSLTEVGTIPTDNCIDVFVSGRYAYTADYNGSLNTIDLGGAYVSNLESGASETGNLQVHNDVTVGGEIMTRGGITASTANFSGGLAVGGGASYNYRSTTGSPATVNVTDYIVNVTSGNGVTLPSSAGIGQIILVTNSTGSTFVAGTGTAFVTAGNTWQMLWNGSSWVHLVIN